VRLGTETDIPILRNVASKMRNIYDRFHADKVFDTTVADSFLSVYIENAIKGYSDIVIVPAVLNLPSKSFLTADYQYEYFEFSEKKIAKMVLSAVDSETNRGWYLKLISEMTIFLKSRGYQIVHFNTQSTNRAVIRVWNKLGFQYGRSTHILSKIYT
jgi:dTDP-4-amino-4,6-dideoxy-D-galactose acyltransferase